MGLAIGLKRVLCYLIPKQAPTDGPLAQLFPSGGVLSGALGTGRFDMNELATDRPDGLTDDEIEWAHEVGAKSDEEVRDLIRRHREHTKLET